MLTGALLATAAGLNAYVPLLVLGLLGRFTSFVELPEAWAWITNEWALGVIGVLFVVEVLVDKVPLFDTINDVLQTVVRPAAGGMVFAAGTGSETLAVDGTQTVLESETIWAIVIGAVIALIPHIAKAIGRPVLNTLTGGSGAPLMSTAEDVGAISLSVLALIVPAVAFLALIITVWIIVRRIRKARRLRREPGQSVSVED